MTHFFEKRDRWGHGRALWVLLLMLFLAPLAVSAVRTVDLENDVANWLPSDDPQSKTLRWFQERFDTEDRILVSWEGSSLEDPRVAAFARALEGEPDADGVRPGGLPQIKSVTTPQEALERMVSLKVDRDEAIRRLRGILIGSGPLRVRLTDAGKRNVKRTVHAIARTAKEELDFPLELTAPTEEEWERLAARIAAAGSEPNSAEATPTEPPDGGETIPVFLRPRQYDLTVGWNGMHVEPHLRERVRALLLVQRGRPTGEHPQGEPLVAECFLVLGSPVAVTVTLTEAGHADVPGTLSAMREAAAGVGIEDLRMGGRLVAGSQLNEEVKKVAWNAAVPLSQLHRRSPLLLSAAVGVVLAFVMLRSVRLASLVLAVAAYTTLLAVAVVPVTNGSMNMVLVVMPTLLSVLTISAAIHVANYWKHAACRDNRTAVVEAVKMARKPCTLAALTTAIGLVSLATSPLAPVRDFGIYSAIGCLISLAVVLYGLPALMQFWPSRAPKAAEVDGAEWHLLGNFLVNRRYAVIAVCLGLFAAGAYGLKWFQTETKVIRYFPEDARVVQDYNFLEQNLAGIIPVETIVRFDAQAQRNLNFVERLELVRDVQNKIRAHSEISGAVSLADFQPVKEKPPASATFFQKAAFNRRSAEVETSVRESTAAGSFLATADEPADLIKPGDERLNKAGDELWRITAQVAIMSEMDYGDLTADLDEIAQSVLKLHAGSGHVVTGMVPLFLRTQQAVLESLIVSFALAFAVIAVVMMVLLKNPISGLVTMLPNLLPVGIVFGLISWNGMAVDIGTMITASVALGIAVDGTLHLITWFQIGIRQGLSRREALCRALAHCGPAMWQTSAAVGLGLLMLYPADLLLIKRFGWLMAALIGSAFVADVIFLPALLAGPLGRLIEKTLAGAPAETEAAPQTRAQPETVATAAKPNFANIQVQTHRSLRLD